MLASGGYPWTVIRVEDRAAYLSALDRTSIDMDIGPFANFFAERVQWVSSEQAQEKKNGPLSKRCCVLCSTAIRVRLRFEQVQANGNGFLVPVPREVSSTSSG
ncbi:MAG: hypothetical protein ACYC9S_09285 [Leptospirales bacterium]